MKARDRWPSNPKKPTIGWIRKMAESGLVFMDHGTMLTRSPYCDAWEVRVRAGRRHWIMVPFTPDELQSIGG